MSTRKKKTNGDSVGRERDKKRRTINLRTDVHALVEAEAKRDTPEGEEPEISRMTRILIREAVNARRTARGEPPIEKPSQV